MTELESIYGLGVMGFFFPDNIAELGFAEDVIILCTNSSLFISVLSVPELKGAKKHVGHPSEFNVNKAHPMPPKAVEIFKSKED
ncbi:hypothetical protein CFP56_007404 [Quercus suber]|uniref:Uncharacterized protein n=1 Tax=Quercus suber TaxID=58331 RepID=A0AAW0L5B0_QUESU